MSKKTNTSKCPKILQDYFTLQVKLDAAATKLQDRIYHILKIIAKETKVKQRDVAYPKISCIDDGSETCNVNEYVYYPRGLYAEIFHWYAIHFPFEFLLWSDKQIIDQIRGEVEALRDRRKQESQDRKNKKRKRMQAMKKLSPDELSTLGITSIPDDLIKKHKKTILSKLTEEEKELLGVSGTVKKWIKK